MKIAQRYITARHTSNLKSEPRSNMSAADILAGAGMAAQQHSDALMLWGVVYGGKTSQKMMLVDGLARKVGEYMMRNRLKGQPRHIAMEVLAYYLHAKCMACEGVGHRLIEGTITREDEPCPVCRGTGKPDAPEDEAWAWLHRYVGELMSIAAGRIMQSISLDL